MVDMRRTAPLESILERLALEATGDANDAVTFRSGGQLTLGVEIELQLIDRETLNLVPRAEEVLAQSTALTNITKEF